MTKGPRLEQWNDLSESERLEAFENLPRDRADDGLMNPRFARLLWQAIWERYGPHYRVIALTVACSLVGVVQFGTVAGSMLPFALRRVGLDPASASAPFVATLVDVTGLVIYFTIASAILKGSLL